MSTEGVQPVHAICIKAVMTNAASVLMTEAAALALAATVNDALNINNTTFLSDCQQLVHFLNDADQTNPSDWRIKYFTQLFANCAGQRRQKIYKVNRQLNLRQTLWPDRPYPPLVLVLQSLSLYAPIVIIIITVQ